MDAAAVDPAEAASFVDEVEKASSSMWLLFCIRDTVFCVWAEALWGNLPILEARTGGPLCSDFRSADCALLFFVVFRRFKR